MRQTSKRVPDSAEKTVRDIRRATRRHHSAEEKIRIVLEGLRRLTSTSDLPGQLEQSIEEFVEYYNTG
jgi:transposase-like protein